MERWMDNDACTLTPVKTVIYWTVIAPRVDWPHGGSSIAASVQWNDKARCARRRLPTLVYTVRAHVDDCE